MNSWIRAVTLFLGLMFLSAVPRAARASGGVGADETSAVASSPQDAPLILQPGAIEIPSVPAEYVQKNLGWLHVSYAVSAEQRTAPLLAEASAVKAKLSSELGQTVLENVEVRVTSTPEEMAALAPHQLPPPAYASGVAYPALHLILLTLRAPGSAEAPDLGEVFRHELAHVALNDAVLGHHVPRWFNEGFAVYQSGESRFDRTHTLWDATLSKTILPLSELDEGFPRDRYEVNIAYAESADFVRFLLRDAERERFRAVTARVRGGQAFDKALADAYGTDLRTLEYQWREEIAKRYTFLPMLTGGSLLWVLLMGALVMGYVRKRRRNRETLLRWEHEEARSAAIAAARAAEIVEVPPPAAEFFPPPSALVGLPKVEHEGDWHTLH